LIRIALVHTAFQPIHGVTIVALRSARWHLMWRRCINLFYRDTEICRDIVIVYVVN